MKASCFLRWAVATGMVAALVQSGSAADFSAWSKRATITFSGYNKGETLTNFPALVKLSTNSVADFAYTDMGTTNGWDLRFADSASNEIPYEIEQWDTNGTSYVWVQVPTIVSNSGANASYIYMFYGNAGQTAQQNYTTNGAVWTNGYAAVWHMNDSSLNCADSACFSVANSGSDNSSGGTNAIGKIGMGKGFPGTGNDINIPDTTELSGFTAATLGFWYYKRSMGGGNYGSLLCAGTAWGIRHLGSDVLNLRMNGNARAVSGSLANNSWYHMVYTYDDAANRSRCYQDGLLANENTGTTEAMFTPTSIIGVVGTAGRTIDGIADEIRISSVERSAKWVWAEYQNMASNSTFQETYVSPTTAWNKKMQIGFSGYTKSETLTNFPVLVVFSNAMANGTYLYTDMGATNGADLRFTASDGVTTIPHEIEAWDTNGLSYVWVKVPLLTSTASIWAYYGNSNAAMAVYTTNGAVWVDYGAVLHFGDGATVTAYDSSPNRKTYTINGTVTASAGKVSGAATFNGSSGWIDLGTSSTWLISANKTVSLWLVNKGTDKTAYVYDRGPGSDVWGQDGVVNLASGGGLYAVRPSGGVQAFTYATMQHGDYVSFAYSTGSGGTVYCDRNGGQTTTTLTSFGDTTGQPTYRAALGRAGDFNNYYFDGTMDEFRIATVTRSASWTWAEWYNMGSNGLFNSYSNAQANGSDPNLPVIANNAATGITDVAAWVNGSLTSTGTSEATAWVFWGPTDGTTNAGSWANSNNLGTVTVVPTSHTYQVTSLTKGTTNYFNYYAANASGVVWAASTGRSYVTLGAPTVNNASGATGIGVGTGTVNGVISSDGGAAATVYICWGTNDFGASTNAWPNVVAFGEKASGETVSTNLTGLLYGLRYWYRTYATNSYGEAIAEATNFVTVEPAGAFLPSFLDGLQLWLDGNDAGTLWQDTGGTTPAGNGDPVGRWDDKSGKSQHVTQSTAAKRPARSLTSFNGLPSVVFTYSEVDVLARASSTMHSQSNLFFGAAFQLTNTEQWMPVCGVWNSDEVGETPNGNIILQRITANSEIGCHNSGVAYPPSIQVTVSSLSAERIGTIGRSGGVNGNGGTVVVSADDRVTNVVQSWTTTEATSRIQIGGNQQSGSYRFGGDISEVVMYDRNLSTDERYQVEGYLAHKWNLAATLAAGHPYRNSAPSDGAAVAITNTSATEVAATSAKLNGTLTGSNVYFQVYAYWGTVNGSNNADGLWANTNFVGEYTLEGAVTSSNIFYTANTGIASGNEYWYTFRATNAATNIWASPSKNFITDVVTIQTTADIAAEDGPVSGTATVYRSASLTNSALTVYYTVSGTASNGIDYTTLTSNVTIQAGATNANIVIATIFDANPEGNETVTLTLASGPYVIGAASNASLTITDWSGIYYSDQSGLWTNALTWVYDVAPPVDVNLYTGVVQNTHTVEVNAADQIQNDVASVMPGGELYSYTWSTVGWNAFRDGSIELLGGVLNMKNRESTVSFGGNVYLRASSTIRLSSIDSNAGGKRIQTLNLDVEGPTLTVLDASTSDNHFLRVDNPVALTYNTTLQIDGDTYFDGMISGSGNLIKTGSETLFLRASAPGYTGNISLPSGVIEGDYSGSAGTIGVLGTGATTIGNGATLQTTSGSDYYVFYGAHIVVNSGGLLSLYDWNSGTIYQLDAATVDLMGGTLRLRTREGTVNFGGMVNIKANTLLELAGVDNSSGSKSISNLWFDAGPYTLTVDDVSNLTNHAFRVQGTLSATNAFTLAGDGEVYFDGPISGGGKITKTSTDNLRITLGQPLWTGGMDINAGLVYADATNFNGVGCLGTGTVTLIAGTTLYANNDYSIRGATVVLPANGWLTQLGNAPNRLVGASIQLNGGTLSLFNSNGNGNYQGGAVTMNQSSRVYLDSTGGTADQYHEVDTLTIGANDLVLTVYESDDTKRRWFQVASNVTFGAYNWTLALTNGAMRMNGPLSGSGKITKYGKEWLKLYAASPAWSGGMDATNGDVYAYGVGTGSIGSLGTGTTTLDGTNILFASAVDAIYGATVVVPSNTWLVQTDNAGYRLRGANIQLNGGTLSMYNNNGNGPYQGGAVTMNQSSRVYLDSTGGTADQYHEIETLTIGGNNLTLTAYESDDTKRRWFQVASNVTFGANNWTLALTNGAMRVNGPLNGSGKITKYGKEYLKLYGTNAAWTGGMDAYDGDVYAYATQALGVGTISMNASNLFLYAQDCANGATILAKSNSTVYTAYNGYYGLRGSDIRMLGGSFAFEVWNVNAVQDGLITVTSNALFKIWNAWNNNAMPVTFGALVLDTTGPMLTITNTDSADGLQTVNFTGVTCKASSEVRIGDSDAGNSDISVTFSNLNVYAGTTLSKSGSEPLVLDANLTPLVWGGVDLFSTNILVLVTNLQGTLTDSIDSKPTANGLWSHTGSASGHAVTMGTCKGTNTAYGAGISFAAEDAGYLVVTGLVAGAPAAFELDLANIAVNVAAVVTKLQENTDLSNVTAVDADTVRFTATPAESTAFLVWDNALSGLGADVVGIAAPLIHNDVGATNIQSTSAYLTGRLVSDLGQDASTEVFVFWGTSNGGTDTNAWGATNIWSAPQSSVAAYSHHAQSLTANTLYYYRYYMTNSLGAFWAPDTKVFMTGSLTIQASDAWAAEDTGDTGAFTITRPGTATNGDLTVSVSFSGTASNGLDYTLLSTTVVISNDQATAVLTVIPSNDALAEVSEQVVCTLQTGFYGIGSPSAATVTVADVQLQVSNLTVTAINGTTVTIPGRVVSVGGGVNPDVYVCWGNEPGGTDTSAWDHVESLGNTFGNGVSFSTNVTVLSSDLHYYRCYVTNNTGIDWADDTASFIVGEVRIVATANATEGGAAGQFTVYRPPDATNGNLVVSYAVDSPAGCATPNVDYMALSGSVTIPSDSSNATINVTALDDLLFEGTETVNVRLTSGAYLIGAQSNATVNITDDEGLADDWYARMKITFSGYDRSETLTNFPVLVKLGTNLTDFAYSQFADQVAGGDLRFADSSGTTALPYEIESFSNAADGITYVWVRVPTLSGPTDSIWAYWGNAAKTAPPAYTTDGSVWTNGYVVVNHLAETSGTTASDSSANGYDGTLVGMDGNEWETGIAGNALHFNGSSDYYRLPNIAGHFADNDATLTLWVKKDVPGDSGPLAHLGLVTGNQHYLYNGSAYLHIWRGATRPQVGSGLTVPSGWHMVTVSSEFGGQWRLWQNASNVAGTAAEALGIPAEPWIAHYDDEWYDGMFDEVRIANVIRSADWIWAEWYTMASNASFCSYGEVEDGVYVDNLAATGVTGTDATLNGQVLAIGLAENPDVYICWDTTDKGRASTSAWANVSYIGNAYGIGDTFSLSLSGVLSPNSAYAYRCYATNSTGSDWANTAEGFVTAEINIAAVSDANELGAVPGTFTVWRAESATGVAVTVNYILHGDSTATSGSDFTPVTGTVILPAGATNAYITIVPLADYEYEVPAETVKVALAAGSYGIGASSSASITILEGWFTYNDMANGNWSNNATWATATAAAYPKGGDDARIDSHNVTVTGVQRARNLTYSRANNNEGLNIGSGASLTLEGTTNSWNSGHIRVTGALTNIGPFTYTANSQYLYGPGAFVQQGGTFRHNTANILYLINGADGKLYVQGAGARYLFDTAGGRFDFNDADGIFRFTDGAELEVNLPASNNSVSITSGGKFQMNDGTIDIQKGILSFQASGAGAVSNSTATVTSNGTLEVTSSGTAWSGLDVTGEGAFKIAGGFSVGSGGMSVNLATNGPGLVWSSGYIYCTGPLTNNANTTFTGNGPYLYGPSPFVQQGGTTFRHNSATYLYLINGGAGRLYVQGTGTRYLFDTSGANLNMNGADTLSRVSDGASVEVNLPLTNSTAEISGPGYFELLGSPINVNTGILRLTHSLGQYTNATITVSSNATLYTTTGARWTNMIVAGEGGMQIAGALNVGGGGGLTINLATNGQGVSWSAGAITCTGDLTNNANMVYTGSVDLYGPGKIVQSNGTTWRHATANSLYLRSTGGRLDVTGTGTRYLFDTHNGEVYLVNADTVFRVADSATLEVNLPTTNNYVDVLSAGAFQLDNAAVNVNTGILTFSQNLFGGSGGTINVASNGTVRFAGGAGWSNVTVAGLGLVDLYGSTFTVGSAAPVTLNSDTNGQCVAWSGAAMTLNTDLVCQTRMNYTAAASRTLNGVGELKIREGGAFRHNTAQRVLLESTGNGGIEVGNNGRYEFLVNGGHIYLNNAAARVEVLSGGTLSSSAGSGGKADIGRAAGTFDLKTGGTIEVLSGELEIAPNADSYVDINGADIAGSLSAGTFRIVDSDGGGGNTSRLDIRSSANFTNIAYGATVILDGTNTILSKYDNGVQIDASLTNLYGTLSLRSGRRMNTSGGLTVGANAVFEFGLTTNTAPYSMLTVSNSTTFRGTVNILDSGNMAPGTYIVITNAAGTLSTNGLALGTCPATLDVTMTVVTGANGYIALNVTPSKVRVNNTIGATNVTTTAATPQGTIMQLGYGGNNADVYICWGTNSTMTEATSAWENVEHLAGTYGVGTFNTTLGPLPENTMHYYRCFATNSTGGDWADTVASFMTAGLWIEATTNTVAEAGPGYGQFAVRRPIEATNDALTVTYLVRGSSTATPGVDYQALSGSVIMDAGATQAFINVLPVSDQYTTEGAETVDVTLTPNGYGVITGQTNATVTITDNTVDLREWGYKMKITFSGFPGGETLTNFPALIPFSNNPALNIRFNNFASTNGFDLRFSDSNGTELLVYEIENWDVSGSAQVWVRIPRLAAATDYIWAYWGNAAQTARQAYTTNGAVWNADYEAVWHMTATNVSDSTTNGNNCTGISNTPTLSQGGLIGPAVDFGAGDQITAPLSPSTNLLTMSAWVKHSALPNAEEQYMALNPGVARLWHEYANTLEYEARLGSTTNKLTEYSTLVAGQWTYVVGTWDGTSQRLYKDGEQVEVGTPTGVMPTATSVTMGSSSASLDLQGLLDELRVSTLARSATWIRTEYLNQASNAVFLTRGAAVFQAGSGAVITIR